MGNECRGQKGLVKQGMFFLMAVQKFSRNWHIVFFLELVMLLGVTLWLCMTNPAFLRKILTGQKPANDP